MDYDASGRGIYQRNGEYTGRMPSPPRITVHPPAISTGDAHRRLQTSIQARSELQFLRGYDWNDLVNPLDYYSEWKYEQRRQAQKVTPFVYLGPISICRNNQFLMNQKITMIIAIRHARCSIRTPNNPHLAPGSLKAAAELGIEIRNIDIAHNQELIASFSRVTHLINDHLHRVRTHEANTVSPIVLGKVLVACESGNERSSAAVTAYIMQVLEVGMKDALQVVHERRFCINIDEDMKHVLLAYEDILQAKRDVARDANLFSNPVGSRFGLPKRTLDEGDEDMEEDDDMLRFGNRAFRPFTDDVLDTNGFHLVAPRVLS